MWHTDWHSMEYARMKRLILIAYLNDAFRRVTEATLLREATSENAVATLRQAIDRFGIQRPSYLTAAPVLSALEDAKKSSGTLTPTLFEDKLLTLNIGLYQLGTMPPIGQ